MSANPTVCAVILTADRPAMARRAIHCWATQHVRPSLMILDTGKTPIDFEPDGKAGYVWMPDMNGKPIGELRNAANWCAIDFHAPEIICHFDDDDLSCPNRITEQVKLLQQYGVGCVGFNEMLFWREHPCLCAEITQSCPRHDGESPGEAWLYSRPNAASYALGTSLCYWREVWERRPFEHLSQGEDTNWIRGVKTLGVSSLGAYLSPGCFDYTAEPRMIASIHSGNTSNAYRPEVMEKASEWKRVPERDSYCREVMKL